MKLNVSLAASLSTAAVMGGVLLSAMSPTQASACPFSKYKGTTSATSGDSPTSGLISKQFNLNKMGIAGAGIAGVAGIFAAGIVYRARRSRLVDTIEVDIALEDKEVPSDVVSEEILYVSNFTENVSAATPDRDLTLVG